MLPIFPLEPREEAFARLPAVDCPLPVMALQGAASERPSSGRVNLPAEGGIAAQVTAGRAWVGRLLKEPVACEPNPHAGHVAGMGVKTPKGR